MIYFLTDWQSEQPQFESDIMYNVSKVLQDQNLETKTINTCLSPFINYFINSFEFYNSDHFIQLIESATDRFSLTYAPLTLNDLSFPKEWEMTYTRSSVLFTREGMIKAEVFFNCFGFVSQIRYPTFLGEKIEVYSEKGVLLTQKTIDSSGEVIEQVIFDERGQEILTIWSDYVFIEKAYQKSFKKKNYQTFEEVCIELINLALANFNPKEDRLIIDGTNDWVMSLIEGVDFPESVLYIFSGSTQVCLSKIERHLELIKKGRRIVTDNLQLLEILESTLPLLKNKFYSMPLYPTLLRLGESNNFSETTIYWQIEQFNAPSRALLETFLEMKLKTPELCFIIEGKAEDDGRIFEKDLLNFVSQRFEISFSSPEYELVKQYYEGLEKGEVAPHLRESFQTEKQENPLFSDVIKAYLFYKGISFRKDSSIYSLKKDLGKVRIFIDHCQKQEFFNHSLAVSAGIPLLSKMPSPYLVDGKNGFLYKEDGQLIKGLKYYLSPDRWNQSLVESVEVIENNRRDKLNEKWKEVLK